MNYQTDLTLCKRQVAEILSYFSCIPIVLCIEFFPAPLRWPPEFIYNEKSHVLGGMPPSLRQGLRPRPARVAGGV